MANSLLQGFLRFRKEAYGTPDSVMTNLVEHGQSPKYFVISCIDSRANPGTIFNAPPGTFFAHKAMGAIVRPYHHGTALAAALQFALVYNDVDTLVVLGHTGCGAVHALIEEIEDPEIASFVEVARDGLNQAKKLADNETDHNDLHRHAEEQIVLQSVENLRGYPSVRYAKEKKSITIKPWLFDMSAGDLLEYSTEEKQFLSLIHEQPVKTGTTD